MTATSYDLWAPLVLSAIVALAVTPISIKLAPKIGAMDVPNDKRRVHNKPMPRFGGMGIYVAIMIGLLIYASKEEGIPAAMVGCTLIYILGVIDDLRGMKPIVKFAGQTVAAIVVYAMGLRIEFITNYFGEGVQDFGMVACFIITVLWLVAITNAVNLIDGLDGLAAGIVAISALSIGYVAYIHGEYISTIGMMVIAGSCLGFLPYNFHPAKTFMGDGGSQLLGFAIAALSVMGTVKSATLVAVAIPALVLGLPIFDTLLAIVRRVLRHQSIGTADKEHLHHRIMKAGFGQRRAVLLMYSVSGILGILASLFSRGQIVECIGLAICAVLIIGVILTDTGSNKVSIKGRRIGKEESDENEAKKQNAQAAEKQSEDNI